MSDLQLGLAIWVVAATWWACRRPTYDLYAKSRPGLTTPWWAVITLPVLVLTAFGAYVIAGALQ